MNATACAPLVEAGDPDRFLTVMAAPMPLRPRLWPLYAYNLEIARAPWASSEPMVAEMRLQWWIDTVEAMGRGTLRPGHEVTDGLAPLIAATEGLAPLLVRMAEARRWEVWRDPFADAAALGAHLDETAGTLMWAAARLLDAPRSAEEPVRAFGAAAGLAAWFRAVPALTALGRQPLPDTSPAAIGRLARNALDRIAAARRGAGVRASRAVARLAGAAHARHGPGRPVARRKRHARPRRTVPARQPRLDGAARYLVGCRTAHGRGVPP